jgi:hypothetical protein
MLVVHRSSIMSRAWRIFRDTYRYRGAGKGIPFASIGRPAFAWAPREAWRQVRGSPHRRHTGRREGRSRRIDPRPARRARVDREPPPGRSHRAVLTAELRQVRA